jgi:2-polyprenyl-3-methyl-5-hydroxy-6-metoxy-1,4-benzoquinol methylase
LRDRSGEQTTQVSLQRTDGSGLVRLVHGSGAAIVRELDDDRRQISVEPASAETFIQKQEWTTRYPLALIEHVLRVKGVGGLCDEIARDEGDYVARYLNHCILSYLPPESFIGARLLDFGCGGGASTMVLTRMFPRAEIIGVELDEAMVGLAQHRARYYGASNVRFRPSPDPESLPPELGTFDFIVLSAVWEHLLPQERPMLLAQLWTVLNARGVLFLNQTPHRWYLIESHTTGLPLLNYAPAPLVRWAANRFSRRLPGNESWQQLLRRGIRGGTAPEVLRLLGRFGDGKAVLLRPSRLGAEHPVDIWYAYSQRNAPKPIKAQMRSVFKLISRLTGSTFAPGIDLAIEKRQ